MLSTSRSALAKLEKLEKLKEGVEQWKSCIQCSMCLNIPKLSSRLLPCLHLLCIPCFELQSPFSTCCPVCERECLGSGGEALDDANMFVNNKLRELRKWKRAIKFFDELFSVSPEHPIICASSVCRSKGTIAKRSCLDCHVHLCHACVETVHNKRFRAHYIVPNKEDPYIPGDAPLTMVHYKPPNPEHFSPCPKHPPSLMEHYCSECNKRSCSTCLSEENHKGHYILLFITPQYHQRFNFFNLVKELEGNQQSLDDQVARLKAQVISLVNDLFVEQERKDIFSKERLSLFKRTFLKRLLYGLEASEISTPKDMTISEDLRSLSIQHNQLHRISKSLANTIKMSRFFSDRGDNNQIGFLFPVAINQINHLQGQIKDIFPVEEVPLIAEQKDDNHNDNNNNDSQAPPKDHEEVPIKFLKADRLSTWQQDLLAHSG